MTLISQTIESKGYTLQGSIYIKINKTRIQYIEVYPDRLKCYCYTNGELEYDYSLDINDKDHLDILLKQK